MEQQMISLGWMGYRCVSSEKTGKVSWGPCGRPQMLSFRVWKATESQQKNIKHKSDENCIWEDHSGREWLTQNGERVDIIEVASFTCINITVKKVAMGNY